MERNQRTFEKVSFNIFVNKKAVEDIDKAIEYYNNKSEGLGDTFENILGEYINSLKINPNFKIRYDKVRCLPIKQFPYMIHFTINENNNTVRIQAVLHTSRNPNLWQK